MQSTTVLPFVKAKRSEMTFGYLPDHVLPDIVPDMSGSAKMYDPDQIRNMMMQMDSGFVGMRRSVIDQTEAVRQLILYTIVPKLVDGKMQVAVYQRAAGSEAKLKDGLSFGLGGHVEPIDMAPHQNEKDDNQDEVFNDCPSSYFSTLHSGLREVSEEIEFICAPGEEVPMIPQDMANAILGKYGFTAIASAPAAGALTDHAATAVFTCEDFVICKEEGDTIGKLFYTKPTGIDEIYRLVMEREPTTNIVKGIETELLPIGFLSDYKPEQKGFIGNTHLAVVAIMPVPSNLGFNIKEANYTTIGWKTKEEVQAEASRYEAWSKILIEHFDEIEQIVLEESRRVAALTHAGE